MIPIETPLFHSGSTFGFGTSKASRSCLLKAYLSLAPRTTRHRPTLPCLDISNIRSPRHCCLNRNYYAAIQISAEGEDGGDRSYFGILDNGQQPSAIVTISMGCVTKLHATTMDLAKTRPPKRHRRASRTWPSNFKFIISCRRLSNSNSSAYTIMPQQSLESFQ